MTGDLYIQSVIDQIPSWLPLRDQIAMELRAHIVERTAQGSRQRYPAAARDPRSRPSHTGIGAADGTPTRSPLAKVIVRIVCLIAAPSPR